MQLRTIIAGSRHLTRKQLIDEAVFECAWSISEVVSGCCQGIDSLAEQWAERLDISVKRFPARWQLHGKAAGPIRNRQMAGYAEALILIWNGESKGSADMLRAAQAAGLRIFQLLV